MKLGWNAIVKNESAVLERCVKSLLPHIDYGIVVDTGSTDGTPELLTRLFAEANKSLQLTYASFVNFEQARNEALQVARTSPFDWDYMLLVDADMELRVKRSDWTKKLNGGLAYDLRQTAGNIGYYNRRLVNRQAVGNFVGVTHEYLDIPSAGTLEDAYFIDHADGANRPDKLARDIALLETALQTERRLGLIERYEFYLAQSYFDSGNWAKAAEHYFKRVILGGFEEERWNAQLHYAHCLDNMGDKARFLWEMLQAYRMRPHRAEVLYDLTKYFRERGENHTSLLFSEAGMRIPHARQDLLFVNDYVYQSGLKEEFSICAYYDESRRVQGAKVNNELALAGHEQAKFNMYWYLEPLSKHVPSFRSVQLKIDTPDGYTIANPSVINYNNKLLVLVRTVNYTITPEGAYAIRGPDGSPESANDSNPIHTRNFLVSLSADLKVNASNELLLPENLPPPAYGLVRGFEDSRLFEWNDNLWTVSAARELTAEGWCDQVLAPITERGYGETWQRLLFKERRHEKNWMPWVRDGQLNFVYRLDTLVDATGRVIAQFGPGINVEHINGGSQVVRISPEVHIALVHETRPVPGAIRRYYQHRFVRFRRDGCLSGVSQPFVFHDKRIEFAAGLAYFPQERQLLVSYGIMDREAWLAWMDVDQVLSFIEGVP